NDRDHSQLSRRGAPRSRVGDRSPRRAHVRTAPAIPHQNEPLKNVRRHRDSVWDEMRADRDEYLNPPNIAVTSLLRLGRVAENHFHTAATRNREQGGNRWD